MTSDNFSALSEMLKVVPQSYFSSFCDVVLNKILCLCCLGDYNIIFFKYALKSKHQRGLPNVELSTGRCSGLAVLVVNRLINVPARLLMLGTDDDIKEHLFYCTTL